MTRRRIARALLLACALLSVLPVTTAAAAPAGSESNNATRAYAAALRAAAAKIDRAAAIKKTPVGAVPALHLPPPPAAVAGKPASTLTLDTWLGAGLGAARREKASVARAADLRALAASLRKAAELSTQPPSAAPRDLGATVARVLADPAFHKHVKPPPKPAGKSWLETLLQMFFDWWAKLFGRAIGAAISVPAIGNIVAGVLLAAAAAALLVLAFRVAMYLVRRRSRAAGSPENGTMLEVQAGVEETHAAACAAARRGSYGVAIALLFQATLLALDRSGRVPYDAARTAGEYRRAVRRSIGAATAPFETIASAFTNVAYAQTPAAEHDWRAADAAYSSLAFTAAQRR